MFTQTWKKYLPVIVILIKRSGIAEQTLTMNHTDFERAAGGRKIKYSFTHLLLNKSRVINEAKLTPVARELAFLLKEDELTRMLISDQNLEFSLNNVFKLTIKNNTTPVSEDASLNEGLEENEDIALTEETTV